MLQSRGGGAKEEQLVLRQLFGSVLSHRTLSDPSTWGRAWHLPLCDLTSHETVSAAAAAVAAAETPGRAKAGRLGLGSHPGTQSAGMSLGMLTIRSCRDTRQLLTWVRLSQGHLAASGEQGPGEGESSGPGVLRLHRWGLHVGGASLAIRHLLTSMISMHSNPEVFRF